MIKAGSLPSKQLSPLKNQSVTFGFVFFYKGDNIKKDNDDFLVFAADVRNMCSTAAVMKRIKNNQAL